MTWQYVVVRNPKKPKEESILLGREDNVKWEVWAKIEKAQAHFVRLDQ
jgi:hypothetical protein